MPIDNVTPGETIFSVWGNSVADLLNNLLEVGDYTPALDAATIGTGGKAEGHYWFLGVDPMDDESEGLLTVQVYLEFGTSGGFSGACTVSLPPGYQWVRPGSDSASNAILESFPIGWVHFAEGDGDTTNQPIMSVASMTSTTGIRITRSNTAVSPLVVTSNISATSPLTWEPGDKVRVQAGAWAKRVPTP